MSECIRCEQHEADYLEALDENDREHAEEVESLEKSLEEAQCDIYEARQETERVQALFDSACELLDRVAERGILEDRERWALEDFERATYYARDLAAIDA